MTSNFQIWEKDPLFFAAEQVQDSADRLDSAYRAWMHVKSLSLNTPDSSALDFCRRELSTALGIAKWQFEEFEKVSLLSTDAQQQHAEDDTPQRHRQFIDAIGNQLSAIKNALLCSKDERDLNVLPAVRLCQGESDQLAHFLSGSRLSTGEDAEDMLGSCTSSGKGFKEIVTSCQSAPSMSSSGLDRGKALFVSLDECSSSPTCISVNTNEPCILKDHIVIRPEIHFATVKDTDFVRINVEQSTEAPTCGASGPLIGDFYNSAGRCIERPNGHRRSTSLGGGLSFCTERANGHHRTASVEDGLSCWKDGLSSSEHKASPNRVTSNVLSYFWCSVVKASLIFRVGGPSSNGLKRWKDGEGDAIDPCNILHSDIEQDCSIFLCQDGSWSEMQSSQSFRKGVSSRRLLQATSAVLAVVGLLGLYLH